MPPEPDQTAPARTLQIEPEALERVVAEVAGVEVAKDRAAILADHLRLFLIAYSQTGRKHESARTAGIGTTTITNWRRRSPVFEAAVQEALEVYRESLVCEVHRRGVKGVDEPVFFQGEVCGHIRRYSDRLLEL